MAIEQVTAETKIEVNFASVNDVDVFEAKHTYNTGSDSKTSYANGTGSQQVNRVWADRRTLTAASGTDDINLSALADPVTGQTFDFDKIRFIYIKNQEPSGGANLLVGGSGSNAWTGPFNGSTTLKLKIGPKDEWCQTNKLTGFNVPTSGSTLRITHDGSSSGALDYDIIVGGSI